MQLISVMSGDVLLGEEKAFAGNGRRRLTKKEKKLRHLCHIFFLADGNNKKIDGEIENLDVIHSGRRERRTVRERSRSGERPTAVRESSRRQWRDFLSLPSQTNRSDKSKEIKKMDGEVEKSTYRLRHDSLHDKLRRRGRREGEYGGVVEHYLIGFAERRFISIIFAVSVTI